MSVSEGLHSTDEKFMREAIKQAKKAALLGEVPIGCVIVYTGDVPHSERRSHESWAGSFAGRMKPYEGRIIGRGYNRRNTDLCTLSHAEITAIKKASRVVGDWRLEGCTLYVTLEPCQMCAGTIVQARIGRVVIGAMSPKSGCAGSVINLLRMKEFNHIAEVESGVLEGESAALLKRFFAQKRERT